MVCTFFSVKTLLETFLTSLSGRNQQQNKVWHKNVSYIESHICIRVFGEIKCCSLHLKMGVAVHVASKS